MQQNIEVVCISMYSKLNKELRSDVHRLDNNVKQL